LKSNSSIPACKPLRSPSVDILMLSLLDKEDSVSSGIRRRTFLIGVSAAAIGLTWLYRRKREPAYALAASPEPPKMVKIIEFSDAGQRKSTESVLQIRKAD
jgi:hypothetical protein